MTDIIHWLSEHIWVPILVASVFLVGLSIFVTWFLCRYRRRLRYDYTALEEDLSVPSKLYKEKQDKTNALREKALLNFQYYLRASERFTLLEQLVDIGSRDEKWWFSVRDSQQKQNQLASLTYKPIECKPPFTAASQTALNEITSIIQHPYISPIYVGFSLEQAVVITIELCGVKGSLKDVIYKSHWKDSWRTKYQKKGRPLPVELIRSYGRQILEAMVYLEKMGFPPISSVHSGNVILNGRTCCLSGYDNTLLGHKPRLYDLLLPTVRDAGNHAMPSALFGHLLFEMGAGYELSTPAPEYCHLLVCNPAVAEVLNFIFFNQNCAFPNIEQVKGHEFFMAVEPTLVQSAQINLSAATKSLLRAIRHGKPRLSRKPSAASLKTKSKTRRSLDVQSKPESHTKSPHSPVTNPPIASYPPVAPPTAPRPPVLTLPPIAPRPPPRKKSVTASLTMRAPRSETTALLCDIRQGAKLRKMNTNDRSAPKV